MVIFRNRNDEPWNPNDLQIKNAVFEIHFIAPFLFTKIYCKYEDCCFEYAGATGYGTKTTSNVLKRWTRHVSAIKMANTSFGNHFRTHFTATELKNKERQNLTDMLSFEIHTTYIPTDREMDNTRLFREVIRNREFELYDQIPPKRRINTIKPNNFDPRAPEKKDEKPKEYDPFGDDFLDEVLGVGDVAARKTVADSEAKKPTADEFQAMIDKVDKRLAEMSFGFNGGELETGQVSPGEGINDIEENEYGTPSDKVNPEAMAQKIKK